jgi:predicted porin
MQKKLLSIAVAGALGAPVAALAQTEVYGTLNASLGLVKYTSPTSASAGGSISKWDVANHASNYGIRSRENLGGGLTAWGQIEQNAPLERSNDASSTPASRNTAVGLQGGFGNFFIGQWTTPWADLDSLWSIGTVGGWGPVTSVIGRRETTGQAPNPNCVNGHGLATVPVGLVGAGGTLPFNPVCNAVESAGGVGHPFWRRISQSAFYQSPVMAGVQIKLAAQAPEGKSNTATTITGGATFVSVKANPWMWSTSVQWAGMGGRARIGAGYDSHKDFSAVGKSDTGYTVKGGWDFGVIDVGLAYEHMKYGTAASGDVKATQYGIALAIPVGAHRIRGSYAMAKDLDGAGLAKDTGAKTYNIGYEHRFSKRTQVGIGYAAIKNEASAAVAWTGLPPNGNGFTNGPNAGSDVSTFFVNMIHRF